MSINLDVRLNIKIKDLTHFVIKSVVARPMSRNVQIICALSSCPGDKVVEEGRSITPFWSEHTEPSDDCGDGAFAVLLETRLEIGRGAECLRGYVRRK